MEWSREVKLVAVIANPLLNWGALVYPIWVSIRSVSAAFCLRWPVSSNLGRKLDSACPP